MKICYNSHRLITRSNRLVSGQQKSKETQTNPPNNQPKPTKSDQSVKMRQVKHVCALTTWCIAQKPRLSQHLQQLIECHTSSTCCHVANSYRPCTGCYQSKGKYLDFKARITESRTILRASLASPRIPHPNKAEVFDQTLSRYSHFHEWMKSDRAKQPFSSTVGHKRGDYGATLSWEPDPDIASGYQ